MAATEQPATETPATPPKAKRELSPDQRDFLDKLTKREASGLLLAAILVIANYTPLFEVPWPLSIWTLLHVVIVAFALLTLTVWYLWAQINAVDHATRDETPVVDRQGTDDMGWSIFPRYALILIYGTTIIGGLFMLFAPDALPRWVIRTCLVSWPMLFYTPFVVACERIDLNSFGKLYQRINRLRGRLTRFEDSHS